VPEQKVAATVAATQARSSSVMWSKDHKAPTPANLPASRAHSLSPAKSTTEVVIKKPDGNPKAGEQNDDLFVQTLDDATRTYLKRLRLVNPKAIVTLPDGFYDTDEEDAAKDKARMNLKMTSRRAINNGVDDSLAISQGGASKLKKRQSS